MSNKIDNIIKDKTGKQAIAMPDHTNDWLSWYKGNVEKFHKYKYYNGNTYVNAEVKTLNMGKKVAEDWANLLLNEKTNIVYGEKSQQDALNQLLEGKNINFWVRGNEGVEKAFALGNGAFVESNGEDGTPYLQFVDATKIVPISFENGKVTECAFVNVSNLTTVIQIHLRNQDGTYYIRTLRYKKSQSTTADDIGTEEAEAEPVQTRSKKPWFQFIKPNIANNVDVNSPMGISIFANAIDVLKGVDLAYDGFCEEMRLGRGRIFINQKNLVDYADDKPIFDNSNNGFYFTKAGDNEGKTPITFYNPQLRTENYFNGINNSLNLLSAKTGFGQNHYRFDVNGISTATQIISENSEMFRNLKKHEILFEEVIKEVCLTLMYISNEFSGNPNKFNLDTEIKVQFDDSIIEDKESQKLNDRSDVNLGVMSLIEYRMKWYGETEEEATKKIQEIKAERNVNIANYFGED